jgi:hypothetical protein
VVVLHASGEESQISLERTKHSTPHLVIRTTDDEQTTIRVPKTTPHKNAWWSGGKGPLILNLEVSGHLHYMTTFPMWPLDRRLGASHSNSGHDLLIFLYLFIYVFVAYLTTFFRN